MLDSTREAYRETTSRFFAESTRPERLLYRRLYRLARERYDSRFCARAEVFIACLRLGDDRWQRSR